MAQQTTTEAMEALNASEHVETQRGVNWDWVAVVPPQRTTAGPALDPVQAWAAHYGEDAQPVRLEMDDDAEWYGLEVQG